MKEPWEVSCGKVGNTKWRAAESDLPTFSHPASKPILSSPTIPDHILMSPTWAMRLCVCVSENKVPRNPMIDHHWIICSTFFNGHNMTCFVCFSSYIFRYQSHVPNQGLCAGCCFVDSCFNPSAIFDALFGRQPILILCRQRKLRRVAAFWTVDSKHVSPTMMCMCVYIYTYSYIHMILICKTAQQYWLKHGKTW